MNNKMQKDNWISQKYIMPAEWEEHECTWMIWPERPDNWRNGAKPAQQVFTQVANTIAKYEPVVMLTSTAQYQHARYCLNKNVKVIECANDDSWMRDVGPTFVRNNKKQLCGIDWIFNAWGGLVGGLYFPWDKDDQIAGKTCELLGLPANRTDFVLEGGSIHTDGEGTLFTTEECLLNPNRNPNLTKEGIEQRLKYYLGVKKIIWLPLGVHNDETNGHVDNLLHVVAPGHVVLTWTDDEKDPQYERSLQALKVLENTTDAHDKKIIVTKLHQPGPLYYTQQEAAGIDESEGMERKEGVRLAGSYANFYICNKAIILPIFDVPHDKQAIAIIKKLFPNHQVEPIYAREILLGGGNIHCITQQLPKIKK